MSPANLLIRPQPAPGASGTLMRVEPDDVGFEYLRFRVSRLAPGENYYGQTDSNELGIVLLGGRCGVSSSRGTWDTIGGRADVFGGMPWALYLPMETHFILTAQTQCDLALCFAKAEQFHPPRLIRPADVEIEVRGGENATRQINHIITPAFPAQRLMLVEVYTPGGNWSSYPPHKHDVHNPPGEADLEEIYYYRIDKPEGYAIQKVYTPDRRIDETLTVRDGELVLVPEGYHPVVAAHGYNVYYLNALAGSMRSMAATDDPDYAWVRGAWREPDPRVPVVKRANPAGEG